MLCERRLEERNIQTKIQQSEAPMDRWKGKMGQNVVFHFLRYSYSYANMLKSQQQKKNLHEFIFSFSNFSKSHFWYLNVRNILSPFSIQILLQHCPSILSNFTHQKKTDDEKIF